MAKIGDLKETDYGFRGYFDFGMGPLEVDLVRNEEKTEGEPDYFVVDLSFRHVIARVDVEAIDDNGEIHFQMRSPYVPARWRSGKDTPSQEGEPDFAVKPNGQDRGRSR